MFSVHHCFVCSKKKWKFPHVKLVLWHSGAVVDILLRPIHICVDSLQVLSTSLYGMMTNGSFFVNKLIGQKSHLQLTSIELHCLAAFSQNLAISRCFWLIFNKTPRGSDAARRSQQLKSFLLYILVVFDPLRLPVVSFCDLLCNQRDLMSLNGSC